MSNPTTGFRRGEWDKWVQIKALVFGDSWRHLKQQPLHQSDSSRRSAERHFGQCFYGYDAVLRKTVTCVRSGSSPAASTIHSPELAEGRRRAKDAFRTELLLFYTYVLESLASPPARYIGHTANLRQRLRDHCASKCPHTAQRGPRKLRLYFAFTTLDRAQHFERYLKSGSGHAFAKRHF